MSTGSLNPTSTDHFQIHAYIMTQKNEGKKYLHPKNGWQRMNKMSALGMSTASPSLIHMHTYSCWADHCRSGLLRRVKAKSETRENSVSRNSSADAHLLHSLQQHRKQNKTKQFLGACVWFACNDLSFLQSKSFLSADLHVWLAFHSSGSINKSVTDKQGLQPSLELAVLEVHLQVLPLHSKQQPGCLRFANRNSMASMLARLWNWSGRGWGCS